MTTLVVLSLMVLGVVMMLVGAAATYDAEGREEKLVALIPVGVMVVVAGALFGAYHIYQVYWG